MLKINIGSDQIISAPGLATATITFSAEPTEDGEPRDRLTLRFAGEVRVSLSPDGLVGFDVHHPDGCVTKCQLEVVAP